MHLLSQIPGYATGHKPRRSSIGDDLNRLIQPEGSKTTTESTAVARLCPVGIIVDGQNG